MTDAYAKNVATSAEEAARIVPRAEFRVFGQDIVEAVKEKMWSCRAQLYKARTMPSETYILSRFTDQANVKVRDGLLDIKTRTGLTPEGYEIFQPRGKFQFPVKKAELEEILSHLKVPMPLEKESYSFEDFKALAASCPDLALVRVDKKRYGFTVNGVICEFAYVWFNGARVETACCESEDYAAMKGAVEALGLAGRPNTNYLRAAKAVIGM
ncbi:hypothetical protein MAF45_04885 [Mesosutterella sp. OilRF-GAM-744-9]|uniref:CYTH domain-containing protein n=1 Tax=Mesosutterella porci TaxID=2915351 RepID=A0ABS9MRB8_9BURK|nr:hypothetical protein [Mesosutterella sp. oilRF-744-WT-GAM-9]MCG5030780.1 hypothetical protein [Mesosutterella sp. oilRF-744-WT-GAM-9]